MNSIDQVLFLRHIAYYLSEQGETELLLPPWGGNARHMALRSVASLEEGASIGVIALTDAERAALWKEVQRRWCSLPRSQSTRLLA